MPGTPAWLSAVTKACDAALPPLPTAFTAACRADTAAALLVLLGGRATWRLAVTDSGVLVEFVAL
jgi:hypothetical protein